VDGVLSAIVQDLRFAARGLWRQPGFTAVAVVTLALGIGANSAIFSVVNGVLLRPLPYREPERLVTALHAGRYPVAGGNFLDWRAQSRSFERAAAAQAWGPRQGGTLTGWGRPETIAPALQVTADLFDVLGVPPLMGRTFAPGDDRPGAPRTVVLSHRLWQRRFGGQPDIVGQTLTLDGQGYTVIGVMPAGFEFAPFWIRNAELFVPLDLSARAQDRKGESLRLFARLGPGVTRAQAQAETDAIWRRIDQEHPGTTRPDVVIGSLTEQVVGQVRRPLLVLLAGVGFVLLIACANVANLLLARSGARRREIGIRSSLGASRGRLVRQLLTESLVLALAGAAAGLLLAHWGVSLLAALGPRDLPRLQDITVDGAVLAFTLGVAALTGVLFGTGPALRLTAADVQTALREGGRGSTEGARGGRFRGALVVVEVALALVLMVGAGLMVRSFERLRAVDAGFDPRHVVAVSLPAAAARSEDPEARRALYRAVIQRVRALPGVAEAGGINHLPIGGDIWQRELAVVGAPVPPPGEEPHAVYRIITPGYLPALGLSLRRGRDFTDRDAPGAPGVAIVNEALARALWPGQDPLGKQIRVQDGGPELREVVGVVGDAKQRDWTARPLPEMYLAYLQNPSSTLSLVVRGSGDPAGLGAAVQREIWACDPMLPASRVASMEQVVADALGQPRFHLLLLNLFAAVALLLAAVGIYGVMAQAVSQRTHEIGIRMALGAQAWQVRRMVLRQGMALAAAGAAAGLGAAGALTRLMRALLFEVSPTDPLTFLLLPALLIGVALLACWLPARRAAALPPMAALRSDG
jgi:putative ABC transport system permease protein